MNDIAPLKTGLRHVEIRNRWLRQEITRQRIAVEYTPSNHMITDGLTKSLAKDGFERLKHVISISSRTMLFAIASLLKIENLLRSA
jgi:hypothetical protein